MMISRRGMKAGIVIETLILLAGLGLLAKAFMTGAETYRFIHSAQVSETTGTINGSGNYGFTLNVVIAPTPDQSTVFTQDALPPGYHTGDQVNVLFDPANPSHAVVTSFTALWFDALAFALGGLILAAFGLRLRIARSL